MNKKFLLKLEDISKYRNEIYGFCILWIILFHAVSKLKLNYHFGIPLLMPLHSFIKAGNMGVDIFLFCSGVCLYFSFHNKPNAAEFLTRRIQRLFLPVLVLSGGYWLWKFAIVQGDFAAFINKFTLLDFWISYDGQIWFISCILIGYIMYPYIYGFLFKKQGYSPLLRLIGMIFVLCIATLCIRKAYPAQYEELEIALTRYPVFLVGCFCGKYVYEKKTLPGWTYFIILVLDVISFFVFYYDLISSVWRRWFYLFSGIAIMFTFILFLNILKCELLQKALAFLGTLSLNLYISHVIANRLYIGAVPRKDRSLFHYFAMMLGCVLISWLTDKLLNFKYVKKEIPKSQ